MKLKFKISSKEETKGVYHLVKNLASISILNPCIREKFNKISKKEFYFEVKKLHKGNLERFMKIKSIYEDVWNKNGDKYINEMEKIVGYKLKQNKTCYIVPSLWVNIADVIRRKNVFIVAEEIQQNPLDFILFHELTHLHYTDALIRLKLDEAGESPLMEGVDHLILFKTPIKKLFSKPKYKDIKFVKSNPKFMKELEKIWENRKDFKSFLKEAIKVQKRTKGVIFR